MRKVRVGPFCLPMMLFPQYFNMTKKAIPVFLIFFVLGTSLRAQSLTDAIKDGLSPLTDLVNGDISTDSVRPLDKKDAEKKNVKAMTLKDGTVYADSYPELYMSGSYYTNQYRYMLDAWHPVRNPESDLPRAGQMAGAALPSSFMVHDASYLRLKNLSVSYTFDFRKKEKSILIIFKMH